MALQMLEHKKPLKASELESVKLSEALGIEGDAEMMMPKEYTGTISRNTNHILPQAMVRAMFAFLGSRTRTGGADGMWMWGPSGVGKSSGLQQMAAGLRINSIATTCSREMEVIDLFGCYQLRDGNQVFVPGPVVKAFRESTWLILDEGDRLMPHVLGALRPLMEGKPFLIPGTNMLLNPHPESVLFLTANTPDGVDRTGAWAGSVRQNSATRDTFQTFFQDHHTPADEFKILRGLIPKDLSSAILKSMIAFAGTLRDQFKGGEEGSVSADLTMRSLLQWGMLICHWSDKDGDGWERVIKALKQSYAASLPASECEAVLTDANTIFQPGK